MPKICIQAGHVNTTNGQTGAPGEMAFNLDVANQVSGELRKRGFEVLQTDANANKDPKVTGQDWGLFLAIHYDADIYKDSGGFIDVPAVDFAAAESKRIAQCIREAYFPTTGIKEVPQRRNPNTYEYYMWRVLSEKTPCVIIECGVGWRVPKDSDVLNSDRRTTLVMPGIVKGICKAFNVPFEANLPPSSGTTSPSNPPIPSSNSQADQLISQIKQIVWGKGWPWSKLNKIKVLLPK